jgi:hypothetical protein
VLNSYRAIQVTAAAILAASAVTTAAAQQSGTDAAAAIPRGWAVEQRQAADLNRDGYEDAVLLLQRPGSPGEPLSPARMLIVLLGSPAGQVVAARNSELVPRVDLRSEEDPLANGELVAEPGGFELKLGSASAVGSYRSAIVRYRFAFRGDCLQLVGYDRLETDRASLNISDRSINYLTGDDTRTSETGGKRVTTPNVSRELPRRCLADLGSAATFTPP